MRHVLLVAVTLTVLFTTISCAQYLDSPDNNVDVSKTEDKLLERIEELEKKDQEGVQVDSQPTEEAPAQDVPQFGENEALDAAMTYYELAAAGDYAGTYYALSSSAQSYYTESEWISINTALGSDAATYTVNSAEMVSDTIADVYLTVTYPDGTSEERWTQFVLEGDVFKHELTEEEYGIFDGANISGATASASASASATPSDSGSGGGNTKEVMISIYAAEPADVSISDSNFKEVIQEEITGEKTYEMEVAQDAGMSVMVSDADNEDSDIDVAVYEDGVLKSQDRDPMLASINY
jgi:hypothetical protein